MRVAVCVGLGEAVLVAVDEGVDFAVGVGVLVRVEVGVLVLVIVPLGTTVCVFVGVMLCPTVGVLAGEEAAPRAAKPAGSSRESAPDTICGKDTAHNAETTTAALTRDSFLIRPFPPGH